LLGISVVNKVITKTGKPSIGVGILVALIYLSLLAMPAQGIYNIIQDVSHNVSVLDFKDPCVDG